MDSYGGTNGSFLALDENGSRLFAITQSGLSIARLSIVPVSIGTVQPSHGSASGGVQITLRGSGFEVGAKLTFGSSQVTPSVIDPNTLTFITPSTPPGAVRLLVTNPDGTMYTLDGGFTAN
jgi:hypothetical protein